jgi:alkaline phosphatase D
MNRIFLIFLLALISCQTNTKKQPKNNQQSEKVRESGFVVAFGSCNNQRMPNPFWEQLIAQNPDVWIWGGDVIYSDTDNPSVLAENFELQKRDTLYNKFAKSTTVLGTWDDHDYGVNDGGMENPIKQEAQQLFQDFLEIPKTHPARHRDGLYSNRIFEKEGHTINVILLDTRYFRTALTKDPSGEKRYIPNKKNEGTMLGDAQWRWLAQKLQASSADVNIIMSSIQFLSDQHGFESWGNMPYEQQQLEELIVTSGAKNVIILSGDRHISEISMKKIGNDKVPLYDFTSSGMTHSYTSFEGEDNPYRISEVVFEKNYGMLRFNFEHNSVSMEIWGEGMQKYLTKTVLFKLH